ncbi:MAG: GIY-YIG nuclease family protein [Bryobacterales bacterium]|nr:GIY-YIG nuclease family protein [Bryobacterales bacterium]
MGLSDKVSTFPAQPGVYLWKDAAGTVLYVGKAKNLRSRVRSYLSDDKLAELKTGTLVTESADVEYILVDNEKEALALENNLIKQFKPRFNVLLRYQKTQPTKRREIDHGKTLPDITQGWRDLLRPLLPGKSGSPPGPFHSPPLQGAQLQGGD